MMEPIVLDVLDISIISIKLDNNTLLPTVTISINPLKEESRDRLLFAEDLDSVGVTYFIKDINVLDNSEDLSDTSSVLVTARLASNLFEVNNSEQEGPIFQEVQMIIPITFLSLALTLSSSSDNGLMIAVKEDAHPHYELDEVFSTDFYDDASFFLAFPPEGTVSFETLLEKFGALVSEPFNVPIAGHSDEEESAPKEARLAQYLLFSLLNGLYEGSEVALSRLMQLVKALNEDIGEENDTDSYLPYVSVLAAEAYRRSRIDVDGQEEVNIPDEEQSYQSSLEEDILISETFADIINNNELMEVLDELPRLGPSESYPMENGLPGKLANYARAFEEGGVAYDLSELVSRDGVVAQDANKLLEENHLGNYVGAIIFIIVARAINLIESGEYDHISHVGANWLSFRDDTSLWELPALAVPIANYDMDTFVGLMKYSQGENGEHMPFLFTLMHTLVYKIMEEDWSLDNLEDRFGLMDIDLPLTSGIKRVLKATIDSHGSDSEELDEELEGVECPGCRAIATLVSSSSIEEAVEHVSWSIPALADIDAASHNLEVGSEAWRNHRVKYVAHFMNRAAHLENAGE